MERLKKVYVIGASGQARVASEILHRDKGVCIAGYIDDVNPERKGESFCQSFVLGKYEEVSSEIKFDEDCFFLAVGDCNARLKLAERLNMNSAHFVKAIHPNATISGSVNIEDGVLINVGAIINAEAVIREHAIVNTGSIIEHDCVLARGCHVGPGASLGGGVRVGRGSWIGIGATVIDHVSIGNNSIVGAGAVVLKDVPDNTVVCGVPAKKIKENK